MNKLNELIQKLSPDGVQYKKLYNMAEIGTGKSNRKEAVNNGLYPFYVRSKEILKINKYEYDEEAIIIPGEGEIGEIFHYVSGKYALHQRAYRIHVIDTNLNTKYLYYYMFAMFKKFILKKAVTATVSSIRKPMIEQFLVPVPPIEIQEEIVRILDKFTNLSKELSLELEARQKQYEYYENKLLTFNSEVPRKTFEEVCNLSAGGDIDKNNVRKEETNQYNVPIYSNGIGKNALYGYTNKVKIMAPCITISARGTIGYCELRKLDFYPIIRLICAKPKTDEINIKFLKYYIETIKFETPTSGIPQLTIPMIKNYKIPIPTIEEQERIVNILDKFEKLCNDVLEGLPAEIEARQKQYEFYRDKLLKFDRTK